MYNTAETETHTQSLKRKYSDLQRQTRTYEQLYDFLQSRDANEAASIVQRIREGQGPESILRQISDGDLLLQLSLIPESRFRYQLPYSEDISVIKSRYSGNPYLNPWIYEWPNEVGTKQASGKAGMDIDVNDHHHPYLTPYHAATIIDSRLDSVQPSKWSVVSNDDELMRALLRSYFLYEHHCYNFFQKDYFLDDMVHDNHQFCSSLLVNCVLAHACVGPFNQAARFSF